MLVPFRRVANGRRGCIRIFAPADITNRQTFQALDPPSNIKIARATFLCGPRPGIVDADAAQAVLIFEEISADAIEMREGGAGVGTDTAINAFRVAEPIAEGTEMVNGHDPQ